MTIRTRVLVLLLVSMMVCACSPVGDNAEQGPVFHYVEIAPRDIPLASRLPARITPVTVSEVRPQVDGIIQERLFAEGAMVTKGQALYQIDPAPYEAARNMAQAQLKEAESRAIELDLQEKRSHGLARSRALSQQNLESAISEFAQAQARVARARAELERAEIDLAYTTIRAPIAGRIGASRVTPGALVTARQEVPLATIRQTNHVHADMMQSSDEYVHMQRELAACGQKVAQNNATATLLLQDGTQYTASGNNGVSAPQEIRGALLFSEETVSPTTGCVLRRAIFPNPDGILLPGMVVTAIVAEGTLRNALSVPQRAVLSDGSGRHHVLVLQEVSGAEKSFRVQRRDIILGKPEGNSWLVREGLAAGELVLVEGMRKAAPDTIVNAMRVQE